MTLWALAGVVVLATIVLLTVRETAEPAFRAGAQPANRSFLMVDYPFLNPIPFSHGLTWIYTTTAANAGNCWILDLKKPAVLGEVTGLNPLAIDGAARKVFGVGLKPPVTRLGLIIDEARRVLRLPPRPNAQDRFWLLDLTSGKATEFPRVTQWEQGFLAIPSPDGKYIYQMRMPATPETSPLTLFDLQRITIRSNSLAGWASGWWSSREILLKTTNGFSLFDVESNRTTPLLSQSELTNWLKLKGVDATAANAGTFGAFPMWTGREYQFYLADLQVKWSAQTGYLAVFDKELKAPQMIQPDFHFGWSDHLDRSGKFYIYSGRDTGQQSSAVFLRDLANGTERVLVPEDKAYFSVPNFLDDSVVYVRSNMLWKVDLAGSNVVRVFLPGP